ncbi:hypothetical protein EYF80_014250 [Liparis tanakae]|uniref:Uncharacterized protein n=1 Tax=Liparis tanakae TaxID=230148 RepID=A0A4Z2IBQ3_9TELE|nr:hypothetical protein EYF80_014250 [Liparis tanakae]
MNPDAHVDVDSGGVPDLPVGSGAEVNGEVEMRTWIPIYGAGPTLLQPAAGNTHGALLRYGVEADAGRRAEKTSISRLRFV